MGEDDECFYCGAPATRLCDFVMALKIHEGHTAEAGHPCIDGDDPEVYSCDRPLCDDCAVMAGIQTATGECDRIDHCRDHAGADDSGSMLRIVNSEDGRAIQRRQRIRLFDDRPDLRDHRRVEGKG